MRAHSHPLLATIVEPCLPCLPSFPTRIKMHWAATHTHTHSRPSTLASAPRLPPPTSEHIGQLPHVPLVMHACPPRLHSSPLAFIMHASVRTHPDSALCVYVRSHARTRLRHPRIPPALGTRFTRRYPRPSHPPSPSPSSPSHPRVFLVSCSPVLPPLITTCVKTHWGARPPSCACSRSYTHPSTCIPCVYARSFACAWSRPHHPCVPLVSCACAILPPSVIVRPPPLRRVGEYMLGRSDLLVNK
ncbi:hypothetical protein EV363DRAFT_1426035 [Boletus edulis]|nr:hypothetical protein EV363DRAFT_1426035 [Boletus edulis]